jgi:hypothetical protein
VRSTCTGSQTGPWAQLLLRVRPRNPAHMLTLLVHHHYTTDSRVRLHTLHPAEPAGLGSVVSPHTRAESAKRLFCAHHLKVALAWCLTGSTESLASRQVSCCDDGSFLDIPRSFLWFPRTHDYYHLNFWTMHSLFVR